MRRLFTVTLAAALLSATTHHSLAQGELRPEVRYDVLRFQLDDAVKSNSHREILTLIRKMRATGIAPDGEIAYFEALANYALGKRTNAHRLLVRYLNTTGRKGKNYTKAITLFATIEREGRAAWVRKKKVAAAKRHWETVATTFAEEQAERRRWKEKVIVFGGRKNDIGRALARTATGGFMLAGSLHLTKGEGKDRIDSRLPWITTFDAEGRRRWHRPLGGRVKEGSLSSVVAIPDGGFLLGGASKGFQIAVRVGANGEIVKNFDDKPWIIGYARTKSGYGGIVRRLLDGTVISFGAEEIEKDGKTFRLPVAVRASLKGKVVHKTLYGADGAAPWYDIKDAVVLSDGHVVVAGESRTDPTDPASSVAWILRIDAKGKEIWTRRVASTTGNGVSVAGVVAAPDGGLVVVGRDGGKLLYFKIRADGTVLWRRTRMPKRKAAANSAALCRMPNLAELLAEANPRQSKGPALTKDIADFRRRICDGGPAIAAATGIVRRHGGYLVLGLRARDNRAKPDIWLMAINEAGTPAWERSFGHDGLDLATAALPTTDGGFIIAGTSNSVGEWGDDFMLFKIDRRGALAPWAALGPPKAATKARKTRKKGKGAKAKKPLKAEKTAKPKSAPAADKTKQKSAEDDNVARRTLFGLIEIVSEPEDPDGSGDD